MKQLSPISIQIKKTNDQHIDHKNKQTAFDKKYLFLHGIKNTEFSNSKFPLAKEKKFAMTPKFQSMYKKAVEEVELEMSLSQDNSNLKKLHHQILSTQVNITALQKLLHPNKNKPQISKLSSDHTYDAGYASDHEHVNNYAPPTLSQNTYASTDTISSGYSSDSSSCHSDTTYTEKRTETQSLDVKKRINELRNRLHNVSNTLNKNSKLLDSMNDHFIKKNEEIDNISFNMNLELIDFDKLHSNAKQVEYLDLADNHYSMLNDLCSTKTNLDYLNLIKTNSPKKNLNIVTEKQVVNNTKPSLISRRKKINGIEMEKIKPKDKKKSTNTIEQKKNKTLELSRENKQGNTCKTFVLSKEQQRTATLLSQGKNITPNKPDSLKNRQRNSKHNLVRPNIASELRKKHIHEIYHSDIKQKFQDKDFAQKISELTKITNNMKKEIKYQSKLKEQIQKHEDKINLIQAKIKNKKTN